MAPNAGNPDREPIPYRTEPLAKKAYITPREEDGAGVLRCVEPEGLLSYHHANDIAPWRTAKEIAALEAVAESAKSYRDENPEDGLCDEVAFGACGKCGGCALSAALVQLEELRRGS